METEHLPWLFALLTAGWFGWLARSAGRNSVLWAVGGAAFGLVTSTIVIGLGDARRIAYSESARQMSELRWTIYAALVILVFGWLLTSSLHRTHLLIWRKFSSASTAPPTQSETKPAAPRKP